MSTNARWIIGLLIVLIIGLGVALAIVAGDNGDSNNDTVTLPTITEQTSPTETQAPTVPTQPTTPTESSGGVAPPSP